MNLLTKALFRSSTIFNIEVPKQENFELSLIINVLAQILLVLFVFYFLYRVTWKPFIEYMNVRKKKALEKYEASKKEISKYKKLQCELQDEIKKLKAQRECILNTAHEKAKDIIKRRKAQADKIYKEKLKENEIYLKTQRDQYEKNKHNDAAKIAVNLVNKLLKDKMECKHTQVKEFINRIEDYDAHK